ncbi:uncharacterized protein N7498_004313 [Penicillium cinerascens]|uniref:Uncharacterized protein n=1 Tax=Penicillium cinerascens TaxID=70096 RepID=A0A9W9N3S6_9EURO|nr:uncharacterized protein N7498_004313 [Penicillium cinerascens]KAJ5212667.1 hypothetical protein N7498_004313 [Penicillium cinerascens]
MPSLSLLTVTGYGSFLVAIKHAFQHLDQFQALQNIAFTCSTVGWYQGSAYLVLTEEPLNRSMVAAIVAIAWGSSFRYLRRGRNDEGIVTAAAGVVQAWAALN